ncbi:MAG: oligosaccharide flippase family protein [Gammaproteobacteria bacterium]
MATQREELSFLLKHSSIYGVGTILNKAVAFLMLPLYTRYLTPTDYGIMELIDTTTGLIGIVVGLGVSAAISRFYYDRKTDDERNRLISTVYILITFGAMTVVGVASLFAPALARVVLDSEVYTSYFRISFASLFVGVLADVGQGYLRMQYKSVLFITLSTLSLVVGVSLNVFFIAHLRLGVLSILYTSLIIRVMVGLPLTISILYKTGLRFSGSDARALLKYSIPLLPATLGMTLVNYSDRYFIKGLTSIADAGIYSLAQKLGGVLHTMVTGPFISTFQPRRFQLAQERTDLPEMLGTVFDVFFIVLLFLSLGLAMFTPEIMVAMTTPSFYRAGLLVPLVALYHLIFGMKYHVDWGIMHSGKTEQYMWANVVTAGVQLTGAFFLIRAFGIWGAVYALLISTTFNVALLHWLSNRLHPVRFDFQRIAKLTTLAAAVYLLSHQIVTGHVALTIMLKTFLLGGYALLMPLTRLVSASEVSQARALVLSALRRSPVHIPAQS